MDPADLRKYTDMTTSTVTQRQSVYFGGSLAVLQFMVSQVSFHAENTTQCNNYLLFKVAGEVETVESSKEKKTIRAFGAVDIVAEKKLVRKSLFINFMTN